MNERYSAVAADEFQFQGMSDSGSGGDLIFYWRSIRKRWWAIILFTAVVTLVGVAVANSMPQIFSATSSVMIEPSNQNSSKVEDSANTMSPFGDNIQTQVEILLSRKVVLRAIRGLRLWEQPEFDPRRPPVSWDQQLKGWIGIQPPPTVIWTEPMLAEAIFTLFMGQISTELVPGSRLVRVSFTTQDPELAPKVINTLVQTYIEENREAAFEQGRSTNAWLEERAKDMQQNLSMSEKALQAYREKNNLVSVQGASQAVSTRQMEELIPRVMSARVRLTELESAYKQMQVVQNGDYSSVPWVMSFGTVPDAKSRETSARLKVAELSQNYGFEHPRMVQAKGELASVDENLKRQINVAVASLTREYETARATLKALEQASAQERNGAQNVNRVEFQLGVLEREAQANRELFNVFMSRAKQTDQTTDHVRTVARVIDPAIAVYLPIAPKKPKIILTVMLLGLFGGVAIALGLEMLDNTIKGAEDAEARIKLPTLASLQRLTSEDNNFNGRYYLSEVGSVYSEAIRTLRTGLLLSALDESSRIFMVTSTLQGEGKTTVSSNLAQALAQSKRVLLVETDMRRPTLAKVLGLEAGSKGLADVISGEASMEDCIHPVKGSTLEVMPAGLVSHNPLELLSSNLFENLVGQLKKKFDIILIDTPPVELVSDALAVSRVASGTIYVVAVGDTPFPQIRKGLMRLQRVDAKVFGIVLNKVDFGKAQSFYGEYTGYGKLTYGGYSAEVSRA
jgi:polysaccharide biosynthesis transport protein